MSTEAERLALHTGDLDAAGHDTLGGGGGGVTVEEVDGSPTGLVSKIKFPNGSVSIVGAEATVTPAGGGVTAHSALTGLAADDHPQYATDTDLTTHAATPHGGATAHSALTGLAADDHPQYATDTDLTTHAATPHGGGGVTAHSALTGLAADDHPQYATDTDLTAHAATAHGSLPRGFIGASVRASANQNVTDANLLFDTEEFDTDNFHSTSVNTDRFTIPPGMGGKYLVTASTYHSGANTIDFRFFVNGSQQKVWAQETKSNFAAGARSIVGIVDLAAGDYITANANTGGVSRSMLGASGGFSSSFSIVKLDSGKVGQGIGVRAIGSGTTNVTTSTWTPVGFAGTDTFDTDSFHDPLTNNSRVTIPVGLGGKYLVVSMVEWDSNVTNERIVAIYKNGVADQFYARDNNTNAGGFRQQAMDVLDLVPGDYVEIYVYQNSGSTRTVAGQRLAVMRLDSGSSGSTPVAQAFIGCSVIGNSTSLTTNVTAFLAFNVADVFDTDGFHDPVVNNTRMTVPPGAGGKYLLTVRSQIPNTTSATSARRIGYRLNGSGGDTLLQRTQTTVDTVGTSGYISGSVVLDLVAGDYVEVSLQITNATSPQTAAEYTAQLVKLDSGKVGSGIGAKAYNIAGTSIPNSVETVIPFALEVFDTDAFHDLAANNSRMTIPAGLGGKYLVVAQTTLNWSSATAETYAGIRVNGNSLSYASYVGRFGGIASGSPQGLNSSAILDLMPGDYVESWVFQSSGSAQVLTANPTFSHFNSLSIVRLDSGGSGVPALTTGVTGAIGAQATNTAGTSIVSGVETLIPFATEAFDSDNFHNTVTNNGRLTIPAGLGGKYLVVGTWRSASVGGSNRYSYILRNAAEVYGMNREWGTSVGTSSGQSVAIIDLVPGDYLEFYFAHATGSNITLGTNIGENSFTLTKLDSGKVGAGIGVRALRSATQSIPNATWTAVDLTAADTFDTDAFHDPAGANPSRVTIPPGLGGKYLIVTQAQHNLVAGGGRYVGIGKNGTITVSSGRLADTLIHHVADHVNVMDLVAGDYVSLMVYQDSGSANNVNSASMSVMRLDSGSTTPIGYEYDYVEKTTDTTVTATTEATGDTIVTGNPVTYDGSTVVNIEFFCPGIDLQNVTTAASCLVCLWEDSTAIGIIYIESVGTTITNDTRSGPFAVRRRTPSAGSHTYSIRAYKTGTVAATVVHAGAGGSGNFVPAYIRVARVR